MEVESRTRCIQEDAIQKGVVKNRMHIAYRFLGRQANPPGVATVGCAECIVHINICQFPGQVSQDSASGCSDSVLYNTELQSEA